MKTLEDAVIAMRCRKGKSAGITKRGAYWLPAPPVAIRRGGGNGIGSNAPDVTWWLELRHYRCGQVRAAVEVISYHENNGHRSEWLGADIIQATTGEDVIAQLLAHPYGPVYSKTEEHSLLAWLQALGLPASHPAPDDGTEDDAGPDDCETPDDQALRAAARWLLDQVDPVPGDVEHQTALAAARVLIGS